MPSTFSFALIFLIPPLASYLIPQAQLFLSNFKEMSSTSSKLGVAPHEIIQPAFLYVTAETGELATDEEFNCQLITLKQKNLRLRRFCQLGTAKSMFPSVPDSE